MRITSTQLADATQSSGPHTRQVLQDRMQRMIDERRKSTTPRNDVLSVLLQARDEDGQAMSDAQLMDECLTLFGAGHETTAAALTWAWCLLCQHPDVYQKVLQEVESVLEGRSPRYEDLVRLPYCLQIFKETMRLYPPAASIVREAVHDLEIDGYLVPKGSTILVSPYILHRTAAYFPNPETFDPERFAPEREKKLPRYASLPFGVGASITSHDDITAIVVGAAIFIIMIISYALVFRRRQR